MRCFIAIDIDENIREQIDRLQGKFRRDSGLRKPDVKWIDSELIHLTLKFLGEIKDRDLPGLCQIVGDLAVGYESFFIDIRKLGCFGSPARVLWVGIAESEALLELQKDLDGRLSQADWPGEKRKFAGHLTLCRIKSSRAGGKIRSLAEDYGDLDLGASLVDSICIYKSELTPAGPVYTLLASYKLQ